MELVTRIAVEPLPDDEGLLREALTSLYSLFAATREVLKESGPDVGASHDSVGGIAIAVLNRGLRPFLSKWHSRLQIWEEEQPGLKKPEQNWPEASQLRQELAALRQELGQYAQALAHIAGADCQEPPGRSRR